MNFDKEIDEFEKKYREKMIKEKEEHDKRKSKNESVFSTEKIWTVSMIQNF